VGDSAQIIMPSFYYHNYVHTFYSSTSSIYAHPDTITMEKGVLQGDPLAMLFTCLVVKYALDDCLKKLQALDNVSEPALILL